MEREPQDSDGKLVELRERLAQGEYVVEPAAIAEAIMRRPVDLAWLLSPPRAA